MIVEWALELENTRKSSRHRAQSSTNVESQRCGSGKEETDFKVEKKLVFACACVRDSN